MLILSYLAVASPSFAFALLGEQSSELGLAETGYDVLFHDYIHHHLVPYAV